MSLKSVKLLYRRLFNKLVQLAFKKEPLRLFWARSLLRHSNASYLFKLVHDAVPRPHYGIPIVHSLRLAKSLGHKRVSVIEFGVAGGNGLLNLEYHANEIRRFIDVDIDIYGFDLSSGLPKPTDYRDLPYQWKEGFYKMDVEALQKRLRSAKLILGDVKQSLKNFQCAPIACVMFDLDFYSSTLEAFEIFNQPHLPRVFCYFDDVVGNEVCLYNEFTGELLAINEYNQQNSTRKIVKYRGLGKDIGQQDNIYVFHDFAHPDYNRYVNFEDGTGCDLL